MARLAIAQWRPLGGRPEPRLVRKNKLIFHTMVGTLDGTDTYFRTHNGPGYEGTESHFGTDEQRIYQWQDTNYQADAQLEGNDDCVSVETSDHGGPYPSWSGSDVPAWTSAHLEINAQLGAAICLAHDIPPVLIENTRDATQGIGFHRDGIDPYRDVGERYSTAFGKVCPGDRRYAQRHLLVRRIRDIMESEEDMAQVMVPSPDGEGEWTLAHSVSWIMRQMAERTPYDPAGEEPGWHERHVIAWTARAVNELRAEVTALSAAVAVLSQHSEVTPEEIQAAIVEALEQNVLSVDIDIEGKETP